MTAAERRAGGEVRVSGRTLAGTAMPYGTIAPDFRERFEPGAFGEVGAVDLNLQHDPAVVVARAASLTDGPRELSVRATLPDGAAALALVKRGALRGFSVEFKATRERREAGVRVVERATLTGLALVDRPGDGSACRARGRGRGGACREARSAGAVRLLRPMGGRHGRPGGIVQGDGDRGHGRGESGANGRVDGGGMMAARPVRYGPGAGGPEWTEDEDEAVREVDHSAPWHANKGWRALAVRLGRSYQATRTRAWKLRRLRG